jgi:DNA-binding CsgD family transcriptional regulator
MSLETASSGWPVSWAMIFSIRRLCAIASRAWISMSAAWPSKPPPHAAPLDDLSPREREVLGLMAEGRSNAAIADELVLSIGAIEKHVANVFTRLRLAPSSSERSSRQRRYLVGASGQASSGQGSWSAFESSPRSLRFASAASA